MKLKIKEQLVFLVTRSASYKFMSHYLEYMTHKNLLLEEIDCRTLQTIAKSFEGFQKELYDKRINFDSITMEEGQYLSKLAKDSVMIGEFYYPKLWYYIYQPPLIVFYRGDIELLRLPKVSVIGTRKMTDYGRLMTQQIVNEISNNYWVSVSGLALGVDACVHKQAVDHHKGASIAIIPCGLDFYYPKANQYIQKSMEKDHLILSEYLPMARPKKHHFILRNRLVAGISKATVVVEAASKSGSLITANYALQYNREVYALPGRMTDIQSAGCNQLISSGATPITSIMTLIEEIREIFYSQGF